MKIRSLVFMEKRKQYEDKKECYYFCDENNNDVIYAVDDTMLCIRSRCYSIS